MGVTAFRVVVVIVVHPSLYSVPPERLLIEPAARKGALLSQAGIVHLWSIVKFFIVSSKVEI